MLTVTPCVTLLCFQSKKTRCKLIPGMLSLHGQQHSVEMFCMQGIVYSRDEFTSACSLFCAAKFLFKFPVWG